MWVGTVRVGLLSENCDIIALLFWETLSDFFPSMFNLFKFVLFKIPGFQIESKALILGYFYAAQKHKPLKNIHTFLKLYVLWLHNSWILKA